MNQWITPIISQAIALYYNSNDYEGIARLLNSHFFAKSKIDPNQTIFLLSIQALCLSARVKYHSTSFINQKNDIAIPFLMLKPPRNNAVKRQQQNSNNTSEIDAEGNSFITKRILARTMDDLLEIDEICIFKGTLNYNKAQKMLNSRIYLLCELLSYQQSDIEVASQWSGHTLKVIGHSAFPIYFSSYKYTCCINASVHCIISSTSVDKLISNQNQMNNRFKEFSRIKLYRQLSYSLENTIENLKQQIKTIQRFDHQNHSNIIPEILKKTPSTYAFQYFISKQLQQQLTQKQLEKIESEINKLQKREYYQKIKSPIFLMNQRVYQIWKKFQMLFLQEYYGQYYEYLQNKYKKDIENYHLQKSIIVQPSQSEAKSSLSLQSKKSNLFIYPFDRNQISIKLSQKHFDDVFSKLSTFSKQQLIIFVHGYQASSFDMQPIKNYFKFKYPKAVYLISSVNEGRTEQEIEQSAHRLAIQIKNFINSFQLKEFEINFICHSLGGLIGRASLKYLRLHKQKFNMFISICSPHLGYLYHSSTLISTSLWILNKIKKDKSMLQLTMSDSPKLHETYLYQLSEQSLLDMFKKIIFYGSKEDQYVPFWSALVQDKDFFFETQSAKIYKKLHQNICRNIQKKITRIEITFNDKVKDLSNFIGRTAHIKLLNFIPAIELFAFTLRYFK